MTKKELKRYFLEHGSLIITSEAGINVIFRADGTIEVSGQYRDKAGACFKIVKEFKRTSLFMSVFGLKRLEDIHEISWKTFLAAVPK